MKKISISHKVFLALIAFSSFSVANIASANIIDENGCRYDAATGMREDIAQQAVITILPYCDKNIAGGDSAAMAALSGVSNGSDLSDICGKLENMPQPVDPIVDPIKPNPECPAMSCTVQLSQSVAHVAELESALSQASAKISALSAKLANYERCGKAKCPSRSGSKATKGKNSSPSASK